MDHQEALRLQAVEKYLLGELSAELREQFEEHYVDCPECVTGLRALGRFVTASRLVLEEGAILPRIAPHEAWAARPGWFNWLRPVISLPAIMVLAALVVYQITVAIPSAKKQAAIQNVAEVYVSSFHLQGTTRGAKPTSVTIRADESFGLDFDFIPTRIFPRYKGSLSDSSGQAVLIFGLKGEQINGEVHLVIPGGKVRPGSYDLVVVGDSGTSNQEPGNSEVLRLPFVVLSEPGITRSNELPSAKE